LVIAGKGRKRADKELVDYFIKEELNKLRCEGCKAKEAISKLAEATNLPKKTLYKAWLELP